MDRQVGQREHSHDTLSSPVGVTSLSSPLTLAVDPAPKLVVARKDAALALSQGISGKIRLLFVERSDAGDFTVTDRDEVSPPQDVPAKPYRLHNVAGMAAFSREGAEVLTAWATLSTSFARDDLPPLFDPFGQQEVESDFSIWLQDVLCHFQRALAVRNVDFQRELALLRRQQETLQENFRELERYVLNGSADLRLRFALEPAGAYLEIPGDVPPGHWITQELPVPSHGLAAIGLHVPAGPAWGTGSLLAELYAHESRDVLERWEVPFDKIIQGWNTLALARSLSDHPSRSLQLRLCWQPDMAVAPGLSLGPELPLPESHVCIRESLRQPRRPLAMRLFAFPPGLTVPPMAWAIPPTAATVAPYILKLPGWMLEGVMEVSAPMPDCDLLLVTHVKEEGDIQVHPLEKHVTVACLPFICPPGTLSASAEIRVASPKGPCAQFSLAVLPPGVPHDRYFIGNKRESEPGFSGWAELEPGETGQLHVFLQEPTDAPAHLYMATRLPSDQKSVYAWCRFSHFRFSSQPLAICRWPGDDSHASR